MSEIQGLDGVMRRLKALGPKMGTKALRTAGTKAMRIVRDAARNRARGFDDPKTGSNIAKAIVTRYDAKGSRREGGAVIKVGVVGGARPRKGTDDPGHWRLKEFGTSKMPADPFMRPAIEQNVDRVIAAVATELNIQLDKLGA